MPIKVACACGKKLAVKDELAGKKVKCPACQKLLSIPKPKNKEESLDDEWDLGDSAEEDFEDELSAASAQIDQLDQPNSPQGVAWETTGQGWRVITSTRSIFIAVAMLAICLIALVGLGGSIQLLRAGRDSLDGWLILAFCFSLSIWSAYATAFSLCGKVVITVEGDRGTVFTGVGIIGRRQTFDLARTMRVESECVPAGRYVAYELVLDGPIQIRFGRALPEKRQLEVLRVLRRMLRQEQLSQHSGSSQSSSSKVFNDLDIGRSRKPSQRQ